MEHDIGYRQGMNEIVAVIVYYAITEEETLDSLSSREHVEPDSYYIFDKIMEKGLQELYTNKDLSKMSLDTFNEIPSLDRSNEKEMSFSIRKCHYIFHRILSNVDYELYYHINKQKFEPQLFLLRWVRCMLSREFSLDEIVYVWDAIFSFTNENELDLLNYLCVGILVKSRDLCKIYAVLANHQSNLLQIIMKPLHIYDVQELINLAVGYLVDKVDKRIVPPPGVKEETGLIQKIMNLVVEKIGPTPTAVIKTQNNSEALLQALENINKVISITEKSIGL
jgi:Rab-GTPase-TBC domain